MFSHTFQEILTVLRRLVNSSQDWCGEAPANCHGPYARSSYLSKLASYDTLLSNFKHAVGNPIVAKFIWRQVTPSHSPKPRRRPPEWLRRITRQRRDKWRLGTHYIQGLVENCWWNYVCTSLLEPKISKVAQEGSQWSDRIQMNAVACVATPRALAWSQIPTSLGCSKHDSAPPNELGHVQSCQV